MYRFKKYSHSIDGKHPQVGITGEAEGSPQHGTDTGKNYFYYPTDKTVNNESFQHIVSLFNISRKFTCYLLVLLILTRSGFLYFCTNLEAR